jgi:hypothetical protein
MSARSQPRPYPLTPLRTLVDVTSYILVISLEPSGCTRRKRLLTATALRPEPSLSERSGWRDLRSSHAKACPACIVRGSAAAAAVPAAC